MLRLPQTAEYALRAINYIADADHGGPVRVNDIATALGVPRNYLSKTLHLLTRAGVLQSTRGRHGGFQLARPPARLTLAEVVAPFLPVEGRACVLGRPSCSDANPCTAHDRWRGVSDQMRTFFRQTSIADLTQGSPPARKPGPPRSGRRAGKRSSRSAPPGTPRARG